MSRTTWFTILLLVGAVAVAAILRGTQAAPPSAPETVRLKVDVIELHARSLPGLVRASGFFRAETDVTVSAERAGRVVDLPVAEGAPVARGDIVARLEATAVEANLARARAVARETALQPEVSAVERARADEALRLAEHELALRRPVAPATGVVEVHHVDVGEYVQPGTPLLDIIDATTLILDVEVDAEFVGGLEVGDAVDVEVPALGAALHVGRITRCAGRADPRTRRFRIEVSLAAGDSGAKPGMHAVARFTQPGGAPALYLPKAATRTIRGQTGVFVVREGCAHWTPVAVTEVAYRPELWRLEAGGEVQDGATVVVAGFAGLRDGMAVEVGS